MKILGFDTNYHRSMDLYRLNSSNNSQIVIVFCLSRLLFLYNFVCDDG